MRKEMFKWLIAELREPVGALAQLAVSALALELARRARRRAKLVDAKVEALEPAAKPSALSSNSFPLEAPKFPGLL